MEFGRIWAEIDLDALEHNLTLIRSLLNTARRSKPIKLLLAIKADAYGHGAIEVGSVLQDKVDMFGVAGVEEGINLRRHGVAHTPILVLSPIPYQEIPALFDFQLSPTVTERQFAERLCQEAVRRQQPVSLHIEVDTGMGRTGVRSCELANLVEVVRNCPFTCLEGIFTHFPAADTDFGFTARQIQEFEQIAGELGCNGNGALLRHAANTAGLLNFPDGYWDMVRPGLIVYGILPDAYLNGQNAQLPVQPVMTLKSRIVNLRELPVGHNVSYARRFVTKRDSRIAVITAGYGDGYPYSLTNRGVVLVHGQRVPVVGNVCMDLTMLDVTDIPGVAIGDVVTLLGKDGSEVITANEVAGLAGTIPYEIICRVSPRVPRVFKRGDTVVRVRNLLAGETYGCSK